MIRKLLVFDGEYLKGKRWKGYMKENYYYLGNDIIFECEYSNGEINGKGKEYYYDGSLKYEGEYLNGKMWNGFLFDYHSEQTHELKNGKGYIKIYDNEFLKFEGEYLNGEKNGKGKEFSFNNTLIFEGEYSFGKRNGKGIEYNDNGDIIYEGD